MKIGLLECDDVAGRFPQISGGYREMFAALLPEARFGYYEAHRGNLPSSADECEAWLCTGSKYSVYEPHDWISGLARFINEVRVSKKPFVGICFGHQMLAHALRGEVAKSRQGWGVGVLPLEVLKKEPWMEPAKPEVRIQHMHQDQVQRLPEGSVLLGRSAHCEVGMFRVGATMLGIEGHPEFTADFAEALIRARRERIGAERSETALKSLRQPNDGALVGRWIARFLGG
ncbi:MAG: type 1 glutamine amidotransferase [Betaproteobacteria bacterium]